MTIYLCTCGTSAARTLQVPPGRRFDADYVAELGGIEAASDAVFASCQGYSIDDDSALRNKLSAEIHSLARMQVGGSDKVILYGSETPDGLACAHAVRRFLERARPNLPCFVHRIEGLQVTDAYRFRTQGVVNFTKSILTEIDAYGAPQCVLNPTGGFKSLVPYTVLIGMIKGVPAKYIFEQSTALISLPVMPVDFARERLEPIRPLLERIERDSAIPRADLDTAIPFDDRAYLEPLFEDLGKGQTTLSPVGFLVREELDRPSGLVPYLSRRALDDLIKLRGINNIDPERYLRRVAASREQFYRARHKNWSNGLFWLKPGNTDDRYLVSSEGWRLLVWRITVHGEYEQLLDQEHKTDLGARFAGERRAHFEPFVRMELYDQQG